jgi:hypothetical protein
MRSSYGVGYTDQHFNAYRQGALAAGIDVIIFYHYGYPQYNAAYKEAAWQQQVVGTIRPQDILILDLEEETPATNAEWAYDWLSWQEAAYSGILPGLYASSYYIQQRLQDARLAKYPLWLANWQYTPDERPPAPAPWSSYEFVQYTDRATNIPGVPGIVDADIFLGRSTPVQTYGPGHGDFDQWFVANDDTHWTCKQTGRTLQLGNLNLFKTLSMDGNTLPVVGLPRTNEIAVIDGDGTDSYYWSVQFFERGVIVYDRDHKKDSQPGFGASYLGKYLQFQHLDPEAKTIEKMSDAVISDIKLMAPPLARLIAAADK